MNEATVLKRHEKPEALEKRRKRWDLQILRQQRQVERLRAVHEGGDSPVPVPGSSTGSDPHAGSAPGADVPVRTFFPDPDRLQEMPLPSLPEGHKNTCVSKIKPNKSQVGMLPELVDASLRRKREEERAQVFTSWTKCCQHLESSDEPPVLVDQEPTE